MTNPAVLGIDFGRVINDASSHPSGNDTSFLKGGDEEMLATPAMADCFESVTRLCDRFTGRVWIVSKAGPRIQENTERWLIHHDFFTLTGVAPDHVRFVRRRIDKAPVCRELGITHFVDDRPEVLETLIGLVPHLYLFGPKTKACALPVVEVPTWKEAEREILASLAAK